jgi:hypothetical protein
MNHSLDYKFTQNVILLNFLSLKPLKNSKFGKYDTQKIVNLKKLFIFVTLLTLQLRLLYINTAKKQWNC